MTRKGISIKRRREMEREADRIRVDGIRQGLSKDEIVRRIVREISGMLPLQAWRLAYGWNRSEASARIDLLYQEDDLVPPHIENSQLLKYEFGQRRPNHERIEYFCRLYKTGPVELGFGKDYTQINTGHLQRAGIIDFFPRTNDESKGDLIERMEQARDRINLFGLTRNYYVDDQVKPALERAAVRIPVRIYLMDPRCDSRRDRYRIEPTEAAMEDPVRFAREILRPLVETSERQPNLKIFTYNFPISFAIEEIDDTIRVMLYGHGKRGTQGPILVFGNDSAPTNYFADQIRWLERLADGPFEPWTSKGIEVKPLELS